MCDHEALCLALEEGSDRDRSAVSMNSLLVMYPKSCLGKFGIS